MLNKKKNLSTMQNTLSLKKNLLVNKYEKNRNTKVTNKNTFPLYIFNARLNPNSKLL